MVNYLHKKWNSSHGTDSWQISKDPLNKKGGFQDNPLILKYFTIIDPVVAWFKIVQYNDKQADTLNNLVE